MVEQPLHRRPSHRRGLGVLRRYELIRLGRAKGNDTAVLLIDLPHADFPLAYARGSSNQSPAPRESRGVGRENPSLVLGRSICWGRVACAHVQPATVKAHAPVGFLQVLNIRLRPSPREDIGATNEPSGKDGRVSTREIVIAFVTT